MRILLVKLSSFGDIIHTLPALQSIKHILPHSVIDWVVNENFYEFLGTHPHLENIIPIPYNRWKRITHDPSMLPSVISDIFSTVGSIRHYKYDLTLDFQGLLKSVAITLVAHAKKRVGLQDAREGSRWFYDKAVEVPDGDMHAVDRYMLIPRYIAATYGRGNFEPSISFVLPYNKNAATSLKHSICQVYDTIPSPLVLFCPGARWESKLWIEGRFALVADIISAELGVPVVFVGSPADVERVDRICALMKHQAINMTGETSLQELTELARLSDILVTVDTGPMHLAAALRIPVVALFGPTSPTRTGPYGTGHVVISHDVGCNPCFAKTCAHKTCMRSISVEEVVTAALTALKI